MAHRRRRGRGAVHPAGFAVLLITAAVVVALLGALVVHVGRQFAADRAFHPIEVPSPKAPAPAAAQAVAALTASPRPAAGTPAAGTLSSAQPPSAAGVMAALAGPLASPVLGAGPSIQILNAMTGEVLVDHGAGVPVAPASTAKVVLAAAALTAYPATARFTTSVVRGPVPGSVVLVGGGDPTLTAAAATAAPAYPQAARITDLAAQVRRALGASPVTSITVDDGLFTGPETAPGWGAADAPSEYASPITAAMIDGGRDAPGSTVRSATPDLAAARALGSALAANDPAGSGHAIATVQRGTAPASAAVLGRVGSAQVATLVEQMLSSSDDVIAEVLARQVARAAHQPASFAGATAALSSTLAPMGVIVGGGLRDGSGLSTQDRVSVAVTAQVLSLAAVGQPRWRPLLAALPTAAWDGTLADRYRGAAAPGAGRVRAKTGTLGDQGVSAEAGIVQTADGSTLVFAMAVTGVAVDPARAGLDQVAATLAQCGCR